MKFGLISDIHREYRSMTIKTNDLPEVDVMLLAGDISTGASGIKWAYETFVYNGIETIYIAGNHEFYTRRYTYDQVRERLTYWGLNDNLYYLQNSARVYEDKRIVILGATLWTDFKLNGNQRNDLLQAPSVMNDYRWKNGIRPLDLLNENHNSSMWLQDQLTFYRNQGYRVIFMTHHAPCHLSLDQKFNGENSNVYYVNTFDQLSAFEWPDFWVHGHVHVNKDYTINNCRVICNPRGYVSDSKNPENQDFNPTFTFEVPDGGI